jgi:hypothetical protein
MTNKEKYKKTFDKLASSEMISLEVSDMKKQNKKHTGWNRASAAAIALFCLISIGSVAYAAGKYFGILDFSDHLQEKVPAEATNLIDTNLDQTVTDETDGAIMDCTVKEALCDSETITIVYEVSAKESEKYLFIPEDALPEDDMSEWSDITGKTAADYAAEKGLELVNIGGGIVNRDELGIIESSMVFRSAEDDVMNIYVRSGKESSVEAVDVTCMATAAIRTQEATTDNIMRKTIHFTLENMADTTRISYIPQSGASADEKYTIEKAEVIQTDLGTYIDVFYTNRHDDVLDEGLCFRLLDDNGQACEFIGGSGIERQENGTYKERIIMNKIDLENTIMLEAYDCYEKTVYGKTELVQN